MASDYKSRLRTMEEWYDCFIGAGGSQAQATLIAEYAPHESYLRRLSGRVLDVGGGAGLSARFLKPDVEYVVVDPSKIWRSEEWTIFGGRFRQSGPQPIFVERESECLPFPNDYFDAAVAFWSLNHVRDPERCIAEIIRTLRSGGLVRLVLEDMEPSWIDLAIAVVARAKAKLSRADSVTLAQMPLRDALMAKSSGYWPIHDDHMRIDERDVRAWINGRLRIERRSWLGGFLTLDLRKPAKVAG